jgi:hypothetical protein
MPRGPSRLRRSDLTKALRAFADAGLRVTAVEIDTATGKITMKVTGEGVAPRRRDAESEAARAFDEWARKQPRNS